MSPLLLTAAALTAKVGDPLAFYSTAAVVIPVLFLALVYQTRYFRETEQPYSVLSFFQFWLALGAMVVAAVGETAAMHVLETQHPTLGYRQAAGVALIVLGTAVMSEPALAVIGRWRDFPGEPCYKSRTVVLIMWIVLIWGFAVLGVLATLGLDR